MREEVTSAQQTVEEFRDLVTDSEHSQEINEGFTTKSSLFFFNMIVSSFFAEIIFISEIKVVP